MIKSANALILDHTSTSPTKRTRRTCASSPEPCIYTTIYFAYQIEGKRYAVTQGCCNHWDCPRCGQIRAKTEYARIVHGIQELGKTYSPLYFQTITCRGAEITPAEADGHYLEWTNRLLDKYRARVNRAGGAWAYVQVTERQKKGKPHSHFLTTFQPGDLVEGAIEKWEKRGEAFIPYWQDALRSEWLQGAVCNSGLGEQYDISVVRTEAAASRYVAKYLFKPSALSAEWPPRWKRVRYSHTFPKLPELKTDAFILRTWQDWDKLARIAMFIRPGDEDVFDYVSWKLIGSDTIIEKPKDRSAQNERKQTGKIRGD